MVAHTGLGDSVILAAIADWLFSQGGQAKWKNFTKTDARPLIVPCGVEFGDHL